QRAKRICPGGVTSKDDLLSVASQNVAVVTSFAVVLPARAPVVHFKRFNLHVAVRGGYASLVAPAQFDRPFQSCAAKQTGGRPRSDRARWAPQTTERRRIEMIHVCMGDEHQIHRRQLS